MERYRYYFDAGWHFSEYAFISPTTYRTKRQALDAAYESKKQLIQLGVDDAKDFTPMVISDSDLALAQNR